VTRRQARARAVWTVVADPTADRHRSNANGRYNPLCPLWSARNYRAQIGGKLVLRL